MATIVGLVHLTFRIPQATSLKDKRRAFKSFKDRLANRHNVSIAEVDGLDDRRWGVLAVGMVGSERRYVEGALQQIINGASVHRDMVLADCRIEWL